MICNGNSLNGHGAHGMDDRKARSLPWLFLVLVPGYVAGWPAA